MLRRLFDPCCPEAAHEALDGEGVVVGNDLTQRRPRFPLLGWWGIVVGAMIVASFVGAGLAGVL